MRVVARDLPWINGIHIANGSVYLVTDKTVLMAPLGTEGELLDLRPIITDLPDAGQHPNRTLAIGPDGMLYVTVGSTCNACRETNPLSATIQQYDAHGGNRKTFAEGLRNTIGFDWHPGTRQLWAMDMGSDWRGDTIPPDELNRIELTREGTPQHYGWPWCYAERQVDRHFSQPPPGETRQEFCSRTVPSVLTYEAHSSPVNFLFARGDAWPAEYRNNAFVTFRGSWNREPASGYKVSRLRMSGDQPAGFEDFITGWLSEDGATQYGRVAGLAFWNDGSMLISDDENGVIYRVLRRQ
jgi:glucose/arabinose dehydrogenase